MKKKRRTTSMSKYYIKVTKCCASCAHKEIDEMGERTCKVTKQRTESSERCRKWRMAKGLQNAGMSGGVVRLKGTTEVVIR